MPLQYVPLQPKIQKISSTGTTNRRLKPSYSDPTLKMLGCFNPTLGQIWTNPNIIIKNVNPMAGFIHI